MSTATQHRLSLADHGRRMTLQEFLDADEGDGYRYELARGVLEVTEVPNEPHEMIVFHLLDEIAAYGRTHPGTIHRWGGASAFRLWLPGLVSGRNPDVAVALQGAPKDYRKRRIPSLVMEVVSPGPEAHIRDYVTKREEYLAYGLLEYWIGDPIERRITVLTRRGDVWDEHVFAGEQAATGLVLPGFVVRLPDLWAAAEGEDEAAD
jgi:Uma2 family endonuclease